MAAVNSTRGVKLVVKVGNGASPEVFTKLCTINAERGITFNAQTNDATVPDCDDPDKIAWLAREKQSLSVDVTGGGMNHKSDNKKLWDWWRSEDSRNCQVILDDDDPANVITYEGAFHLTQFDMTGNVGEKVNSTMTLSSDGEVTATFGANVGGE
ncbi:phage tail tube protein [Brevundimonas sp. UBA5866]|uniref:phage tail tube protein n=1 Tax=Brevundimonas sp. UBA5866 TaxID=1946132 RepID=UPI0025BA22E0|nr:phage tail tube protein [Brevundimonas sp. UBA5866]